MGYTTLVPVQPADLHACNVTYALRLYACMRCVYSFPTAGVCTCVCVRVVSGVWMMLLLSRGCVYTKRDVTELSPSYLSVSNGGRDACSVSRVFKRQERRLLVGACFWHISPCWMDSVVPRGPLRTERSAWEMQVRWVDTLFLSVFFHVISFSLVYIHTYFGKLSYQSFPVWLYRSSISSRTAAVFWTSAPRKFFVVSLGSRS